MLLEAVQATVAKTANQTQETAELRLLGCTLRRSAGLQEQVKRPHIVAESTTKLEASSGRRSHRGAALLATASAACSLHVAQYSLE